MKRALGIALLVLGPLFVGGGVLAITEWAEDRRLMFAAQITLGVSLIALGIFIGVVGTAIMRRRL
jgi:hypothetical protein